MALINCPQCGAIGEEGTICEFCGSIIIQKAKIPLVYDDLLSQKKIREKTLIIG